MSVREQRIRKVLREAKALAVEYYQLTGKPLGVTGEVAELEAANALDLELADARTAGYDAIGKGKRAGVKYQIKGRAVTLEDRYTGKVPKIDLEREFDAVLLVLLDKTTFDAVEIWEATREYVERRLKKPGSRSRNERGSMNISQFKSDKLGNAKSERVWVGRATSAWEEARLAKRRKR